MTARIIRSLVAGSVVVLVGCATISVPERIEVGYGGSAKVDSSRVPRTGTHEDCRGELTRAYTYIRSLERKVEKLEEDKGKLKRENAVLKKRAGRYSDD